MFNYLILKVTIIFNFDSKKSEIYYILFSCNIFLNPVHIIYILYILITQYYNFLNPMGQFFLSDFNN